MAKDKEGKDKEKDAGQAPAGPPKAILEEILGPTTWTLLTENPIAKAYRSIPQARRDVLSVSIVAFLIFIPWLGAVGLWDPWETHYGEVARMMLAKRDLVYPWWQDTYFFSKPVGLMWLELIPMLLAGTLSPVGPVGTYTEWFMRMPVAALAIAAVAMLTWTASRLFNRRVGLIAGFALASTPLYFFMARQAITDMPFVACMVIAMCCFLIAEFDPAMKVPAGEPGAGLPDKKRTAIWWYTFYAFIALATLFKSLLPPGLAGLAILFYILASGDWSLVKRARIPTGAILFLAIAAPWVVIMCFFDQKEAEGQVFWYRYFVHDLGARLVSGVHTTTPKDSTTFTYFIEQLGFGLFPWVGVVPGAFVAAVKGSPRSSDFRARVIFFFAAWALTSFAVVSLSATQFHHYGFPVIPPMCVLFALFADQLWEEGIDKNHIAILAGIMLFAMVAQNLYLKPKHLTDLFVYNYDRPYPAAEVNPKNVFAVIFGVGGVMLAGAWFLRARDMLFAGFATVALVFACYTSWVHWKQLTYHWAQRDIFWTYYEDACPPQTHGRCNPDAPLLGWKMNWKGETFYSQNRIRQTTDGNKLREFVGIPGIKYVITDVAFYPEMQRDVGTEHRLQILDKSCDKYFLVRVD